ncbi:MAG: hypothetical protein ACTHM1_08290 [Solirubrobacteraceae bacterium]
MMRLARAWGALDLEQRLAATAALALLVTMFLPWYELQSLDRKSGVIHSHSINAFGDVSFVEAAIFLVSFGVLGMLFARGERRQFHMPGSDGTIVMAAGCWAALLIFYRVFSRPDGNGYPVGIQWGFFLAFIAAGGLAYTGWRMRATAAPEPPLVRPRRRPDRGERPFAGRSSHAEEDATFVVPSSPGPARSRPVAARPPESAPVTARPSQSGHAPPRAAKRPRYPPAPSDQLSFDDTEAHDA